MADILRWIKSHLPTQRRMIQLYTALLYNAHVKGFIEGKIYTGSTKAMCVPGLNCYSCPGAIGACPLGALQNAVASSGHRAPTYVLGILMLYGLILGRTICGFLCPVGLMQELLHKLPTPKLKKNRLTRMLSWLKYGILAVFVILIPLWYAFKDYPLPAFCKYICPAGTLEGAVGLLANPVNADKYGMLGALFTQKFLILLILIALCVFVYRAFCRFLCPLGAIYGLFARFALIGVKVEMPKCIDCGRCVSHCRMDIRKVGDHECIHCGECMDVCPTKAISFKAGKITLHGPEISENPSKRGAARRVRWFAWAAALVLLISGLVYFNQPDEADAAGISSETEGLARVGKSVLPHVTGKEVGMYAPDFAVPLYGSEDEFRLSEHLGKVVIINFWATWCGPCVEELPYFDEVNRKYGDSVSVVAIHSELVTDDVEAYLARHDYQMPFALDTTGEVIKGFGGSMMLPHTVVIDREGLITYNSVGPMTMEELEAFIAAAD